jgi:hypothetical protein
MTHVPDHPPEPAVLGAVARRRHGWPWSERRVTVMPSPMKLMTVATPMSATIVATIQILRECLVIPVSSLVS